MMLDHKATSDIELVKKLTSISENDRVTIDSILANSSPAFARQIIGTIFDYAFYNDYMCVTLYSTVMPYAYNKSVYSEDELKSIKERGLDTSVLKVFENSFDYFLSITLNSNEVDRYISYLSKFASKCAPLLAQKYYFRILEVDPANMDANHKLVQSDIQANSSCNKIIHDFEHLLKYSSNTDNEVSQLLSYVVSEQTTTPDKSDFVWQLMGYHSLAPEVFKTELFKYARLLLKTDQWNNAKKYYQLILSFDPRNADAYWGLCMVRMQARDERALAMKRENLIDCHEFKKALALYQSCGNEQRSRELMALTKKQKNRKKATKALIISITSVIAIIAIIIAVTAIISIASKNAKYNDAVKLYENEKYDEAIVAFKSLNGYKDSEDQIEKCEDTIDNLKHNTNINFAFEDESLGRFWAENKLKISINPESTLDIREFEGYLIFYDKNDRFITQTQISLNNLVHKQEVFYGFSIDADTAEKMIDVRFNHLKIALKTTYVQFEDGVVKEPSDEIVIKDPNDTPDYSAELKTKYDEMIALLDIVDIQSSTAETQILSVAQQMDAIYNDLYYSWDLIDNLCSKATEYQNNEEYYKAALLFKTLDESFGIVGCYEKGEYCYNMHQKTGK